ncbi:hypothetical protein [Cribrihabitans neustonicus]|uniref:hypothetical protein n=1 Tax=Cribrihabitans neustonicus TaxID=1429085 RepID=UPI003B5B5341
MDSCECAEVWLEFRCKELQFPCAAFGKDQRVTHAAIAENKRLRAVLGFRKADQDKTPPKQHRGGKQRTGNQPAGRRNGGWNTLAERRAKATGTASQGSDI